MLRSRYRHASAPVRSESWGVVDVQVDFTGLAIIRPHVCWENCVLRNVITVVLTVLLFHRCSVHTVDISVGHDLASQDRSYWIDHATVLLLLRELLLYFQLYFRVSTYLTFASLKK